VAIDTARIEAAVAELLLAIGEDPARPGLVSTPRSVADSYREFFSGLGQDPAAPLRDGDPALGEGDTGELVLVRGIAFRSICEHHLLPFTGTAHVAYAPGTRIAGLGRLVRTVEILSARPQLQERLTEQIAEAIEAGLTPDGVLVLLDARHGCVWARGARQVDSSTVTIASRGSLADPERQNAVLTAMMAGEATA
jgi:GTP cyclohydrolase I